MISSPWAEVFQLTYLFKIQFLSSFSHKVFRVIPQDDEQVEIIRSLASKMKVKNLGKELFESKGNISPFPQLMYLTQKQQQDSKLKF